MKKDVEYLTDTELDDLIRMVEQKELLPAPPNLKEQILGTLGEENIIAFKRYRFRVLTTVAAAVLVIFLLPGLEGSQQHRPLQQHRPQKEVRHFDQNFWNLKLLLFFYLFEQAPLIFFQYYLLNRYLTIYTQTHIYQLKH